MQVAAMRDANSLLVYQKSFDLAVELARAYPIRAPHNIPGLRAQTLRAAASISANLNEGCGKDTDEELVVYVDSAIGSAKELQGHLRMSAKLRVLSAADSKKFEAMREEVIRMLYGYRKFLEGRIATRAEQKRREG
jgi:four helix bundle protein